MSYKHMTYEQRYVIEGMLKNGHKKSDIAIAASIGQASLYRELKRNSGKRGGYSAKYAQMLADERKKGGHVKKRFTPDMQHYVRGKLENHQWSPEQITGRAALDGVDMVSHERIYQWIWRDKADGGTLYRHLRNSAKKYKKRYGKKDNRGGIPGRVSIDHRPKEVERKNRIGDFEVDLVIGKGHKGALWTCVDRYSSFLLVENVGGKSSGRVTKMTVNALAPYKEWLHTITNDNGKEFAGHLKIAEKLSCDVYFAHPYASWERGLNEYTNKLLRQYFPKNSPLDNVQQNQITEAVKKLNDRPRKKLGYKTPKEVFYGYIHRKSKLALAS